MRDGEAHAAELRLPCAGVEEDPRAQPRDDRVDVVANEREVPVGRRRAREVLVRHAERGAASAGDVVKTVVVRRAWILDPPVAADDPAVRVAHAWIGRDAVDHRAETEDTVPVDASSLTSEGAHSERLPWLGAAVAHSTAHARTPITRT